MIADRTWRPDAAVAQFWEDTQHIADEQKAKRAFRVALVKAFFAGRRSVSCEPTLSLQRIAELAGDTE